MPPYAVLQRSYMGDAWDRVLFRTRMLVPGDDPLRMVDGIVCPSLRPGDIIVISSRAISACQGRLLPAQLKVRPLSRLLASLLSKAGATSANSTVIEAALQQTGTVPVLGATLSATFSRLQGGGGSLNRQAKVAGLIRLGDEADLSVYAGKIVLPPEHPDRLAHAIWKRTGYRAAIVSVNQAGTVTIVGQSHGLSPHMISMLMLDNPLGNGQQQTPVAILRKLRASSQQAAK